MTAAEAEVLDQIEQSYNDTMGIGGSSSNNDINGSNRVGTSSQTATPAAPAPAAPPKRRMVITHDKYMTLQSLIVLHLSQVERDTGKGLDKDELIDWYLELRESEIQDLEELEYEKELITKMLRKLVKVSNIAISLILADT
jgi:DNA replication licensing factor MCM6